MDIIKILSTVLNKSADSRDFCFNLRGRAFI